MKDSRIIEVPVPKEIWDAHMSIWNTFFMRKDIVGSWLESVKGVVDQLTNNENQNP